MAHTKKASKAFKKWRDSVTHEVPTGPHTDVKKRKINPSFKKILTGFVPGALEGVKKAKGGKSDKNWIQKAVNPKHKGFCTPMTKKTCTPKRKALARTFKKMGKARKGKG